MDSTRPEIPPLQAAAAVHPPTEHCYSDVRCRLDFHRHRLLCYTELWTSQAIFALSFFSSFLHKFYTTGVDCGHISFLSFGWKARENRFYFDFSADYIGVGMISPYLVSISLLVGAILYWGIMWPLIQTREGNWYEKGLSSGDLCGLQGYKVFIALATIIGDGLYNFIKVFDHTVIGLSKQPCTEDNGSEVSASQAFDDRCRTQHFLKDQTPTWFALGGYVAVAVMSIITLPLIFQYQLRWYHVVVMYVIAPTLAFCNAYGYGWVNQLVLDICLRRVGHLCC